ncbi:hypothetical protein [Bradyrhizobium sp. LTSP885]|uniref:hypothetical protein n=1 Tax=Bradyrhizobium sp. LTSP885 TaxID=1619232 RepID=UPI00069A4B7F|nr:hypothetical protein [Bradyrhizobium sp. LTSP885]
MWKLAFSWITGGGFGMLVDLYNKHKDSAVESERIQAAWAKAQLDAMTSNRNATSGFWEMRLLTFIIGGCFTSHLVAVTLDTVFKLGWKINKYPVPFDEWEGSILLSFFGLTAGVIGIKAIASALRR